MLSTKAKLVALIPVIVIGATLYLGWTHMTRMDANILSQDATLTAPITQISATVPGRIAEIHVSENEAVKKGDLLFTLEDDSYRLLVAQAEAELKAAEALYDSQQRSIAAETANAQIAVQQIERARANLELANETLERLLPLQPKGYVTDQQVQDARTAKRDAEVSLEQALQQSKAADALISTPEETLAVIEARRAALDLAKHNLANTKIFSPHDGRVVGLKFSSGQFVVSGAPLFTLVNTGQWFATALYREAELKNLPAGACASVYVMADRSVEIKGRVQGIGWGVATESMIELPSALPYVPKELDWVQIAQRFPVRIELIDPPENLMRIGASASTVVRHGDDC
ncbi:multidrug transporter subunit MdtN [Martelella lutilitoris]|uniref:Multidrug transporter subunit MdtN n=1 Tax=Martelella lutilitoris TaxID=2583532 RepID=A0A7T7HKF8_9HYPH|nr:multidrug transporter subunit MdtN [Martelella lutilitoris]QQM30795.1 multidrug transporter subunit MdtN [Martelella lutilitoris]